MKKIIRLTETDLTRLVRRIINEKSKYNPKKVVHMDDEHIVIDKKRKPNNNYKKKDVSYEDDEWMVIDLEESLLKEGDNSALFFVVLFLSSILSQIPIKQWPQYFAENSRDMFTDFLKFMKKFGYHTDTEYIKNNFNTLLKKALGKLYKEGGVNQDLDETTTFASSKDIHTVKWDRCFEKVSKEKGDKAAARICTDSIGYEGSIKKAHRRQEESLEESMYINDDGELIDDGEDWGDDQYLEKGDVYLEKGDVVEAIIYVGTYDFVFPGHDGDVSITGINKNGNYEGVVIEEFFDEDDSESVLHMKGYLDWNEDYDRWNFYPYYPEPEREEPTPLGEKELEYVITFGPDDNAMPKWMNRLGRWVDVDDETFEEGEDVYNSWEEWIESPYFRQDGGIDSSSGKEGDWVKKSALHSSRYGENYLKQYLKRGPMRVKRYRK